MVVLHGFQKGFRNHVYILAGFRGMPDRVLPEVAVLELVNVSQASALS